uniref:TPR_REGION domain-containing protein n=1 Tax=Anopheles merus TaxID=30066 RepID=A0A182VKH5_ANOME
MSSKPALSRELIQQALGYHGRPLQKIWETERRQNELLALGIDANLDYSIYMARQKHFTLQDRAKRLKLQQFMARKANVLYAADKQHSAREPEIDYRQSNHFAIPPMDTFLDTEADGSTAHLLETVLPGDVVYGSVTMFKNFGGIAFRPLLIVGNVTSFVRNKLIKGNVASDQLLTPDKDPGAPKNYFVNDMICCEVIDVAPDARRLICSMKRTSKSRAPESVVYGLLSKEDIPEVYKTTLKRKDQNYQYFLDSSPSFNDPNHIEQLYREVGLDFNEVYTNMSSLKGRYPSQEYAAELRNSQNSKWAFRSVAQGIEHFKEGRHSEAFQCLNKALSMDPRNVEGLVARGALYANSGSFKKAVEDFETALKLNPSHANARKYMGETLVALGRSYEEENRFEEAKKAYQDCLNIIPHHEEAQNSLDFLKSKPFTGKQIVEPTELELPSLNIIKPSSSDRNKQEPDTSGVGGSGVFGAGSSGSKRDHLDGSSSRKERKKESKKERKKRHKKHHSSSSDSSTDSSDSSDSSSDSSSSSSTASTTSSDSSGSRNKKRKRSKNDKKPKSTSPMGKRLSSAGGGRSGGPSAGEMVGYPIGGQGSSVFGHSSSHGQSAMDDYEQKVRKFLEMPRDEENYEEKVRRFVAEASKYQKERKQMEDKSKKKKKKDEKKAKKESKKKRKSDEKKKSKKKDKGGDDDGLGNKDKLREALKIFENFPVLDELGSKLSVGGSVAEALSALLGGGTGSGGSGGAGTSRAKPTDAVDLERAGIAPGGDENAKEGKWRMMFNKDKRPAKEPAPIAATTLTAGLGLKQHPFSNESDEESVGAGPSFTIGGKMPQNDRGTTSSRFGGSGGTSGGGRYGEDRGGPSEKGKAASSTVAQMTPVKSGPVVLDKFGNFRLASADAPSATGGSKPPEPSAAPPMRRSRSKSRTRNYGSSRSRSRSRSDRRRSRSGSFRRRFSRSRSRSFSRSRSGSYSRSRSRSRSFERRRFDRRFYRGGRGAGGGGGGGYGGDRMGPFGGNRFNNPRGHYRRGGFRDFRDNRFVGGPRGGGGGMGGGRDRPPFRPRYRGRFQRSYSRSMSKSPDRRPISPGDDRSRHYQRRGDSRDRGTAGQRGDSRERSSPPTRRSRADSRDNQRDREDSRDRDHRHRRSEDRDSSKRSKDDHPGTAGGGTGGGAATSASERRDSSPDSTRAEKSSRQQRRSSSAGSQRSSGSTKIPHDIEGRWADDTDAKER